MMVTNDIMQLRMHCASQLTALSVMQSLSGAVTAPAIKFQNEKCACTRSSRSSRARRCHRVTADRMEFAREMGEC